MGISSMFPLIKIHEEVQLPLMARVRRRFPDQRINDIDSCIRPQLKWCLENSCKNTKPGARIAIALGSRGISHIDEVVISTIEELKRLGMKPFIVPAMGSHGGGTAEGQVKVLSEYGITEQKVGAKIVSSMEVVEVGRTVSGIKVYFDRAAFEADGVIPINRVKKHTDFHGPIESGIMKMMVIGLGKIKGATEVHKVGAPAFPRVIPEVAEMILEKCPILCGIGVVENAYGNLAKIEVMPREKIRKREEELLNLSRILSPTVPVNADVLIVDEIGKDISGNGMDTSVVGRIRIMGVEEPSFPKISRIVVLGITEKSEGNASGLGIADFTTKGVLEKIDILKLYTNEIASAMSERGKIPIALATDHDAIKASLLCCWLPDTSLARVVRIKNTMLLDDFFISESLLEEVSRFDDVVSIGRLQKVHFEADGSLEKQWEY